MSREAFREAVEFLVSIVERVPSDRWDDKGLGEWTVRDLVGHASRAILTVERYTQKSSTKPASGYSYNVDTKAVAERGRAAGKALGIEPARVVREAADRVLAKLPSISDGFLVETPFGVLPFKDYLPTRVLEATVHSLDIARAIDVNVEAPERAMTETLYLLSRSAVKKGKGELVALALTGREPLPVGFSLV